MSHCTVCKVYTEIRKSIAGWEIPLVLEDDDKDEERDMKTNGSEEEE